MSSPDEIRARLNAVFQDVFDDSSIQIHDELTADDLDDWDSVSHISLVLAVEQAFNVRLNASEIGNLANVGEMVALLVERGS
ncbi:MAG: acyl carrier protein [Rhodospirillaceae bacterium]|nr:acyl carrier protein [Rhodospirillales bacterium]